MELLSQALEKLPQRCRESFRLKLLGKTFAEVQDELDLASIDALYASEARCRKRLLDRIGGSDEGGITVEMRALLGAYATGTLTDSEKARLLEAAQHDRELSVALSREEPMRELLNDSAARARLLGVVSSPRFSMRDVFAEWLERPRSKVLLALAIVMAVAVAISALK